jgi:hypothetical protein
VRDETRRKLDRLLQSERWLRWLAVAVGAALLIVLAAWIIPREGHPIDAVVKVAVVDNDPNDGQRRMWIEGRLENGKYVRARGFNTMPPTPGAKIVLTERVTWLGHHTYEWDGQTR